MATIPDAVKKVIVERLACYDSPHEVRDDIKRDFGIDLSTQAIQYYDATRVAVTGLSQKWVDLFKVVRDNYLKDAGSIPIAQKNVRLRRLERIFNGAGANRVLQLSALEQAAKEAGDAFTNTRNVKLGDPKGEPFALNVVIEQSKPADGTAAA